MTSLLKPVKETLKAIAFKHLGLGAPSYPYCIEPIQLATLINEFERVKEAQGCVIEIGVARGMTSRFIAEHIKNQKLADKTIYYAIDTFESFTKADLEYEVQSRGKDLLDLRGFEYNGLLYGKNTSLTRRLPCPGYNSKLYVLTFCIGPASGVSGVGLTVR